MRVCVCGGAGDGASSQLGSRGSPGRLHGDLGEGSGDFMEWTGN